MQSEIDMLGVLRAVLMRESEMLEVDDVDGLKVVTEQKHRQVESLDAIGRQRKLLMDEMVGVDTSSYNIEELFATDERIRSLWKELTADAQHCRELNLANGAIVDAFARHVTQTLSILQGKQSATSVQGQTYDQTGHTHSESVKHTHIRV